jgi:hydrogenase expression/formation protein HypC
MCHAIPAEVVEVMEGAMARVDVSGARKTVSTALVGDVAVGDYLLVHVGYALGRVDQAEAAETLRLLEEIGATQ